jgi:hypothetical protein
MKYTVNRAQYRALEGLAHWCYQAARCDAEHDAEGSEQARQHEIKSACTEDSDAGVGQGFRGAQALLRSHGHDSAIAAEEREG